jgi:hypothetical protein
VFFFASLCEVEGEFQDSIDAYAGHHGLLNDNFAVGARKDSAADGRVLAFGVFADHEKVDVARLATCEWARYAGHQANRPEVDVLIKLPAELDQRSPE